MPRRRVLGSPVRVSDSLGKLFFGKVFSSLQLASTKHRSREDGSSEIGFRKACPLKVSAGQVRFIEVGAT
jgi:hypothetical protein